MNATAQKTLDAYVTNRGKSAADAKAKPEVEKPIPNLKIFRHVLPKEVLRRVHDLFIEKPTTSSTDKKDTVEPPQQPQVIYVDPAKHTIYGHPMPRKVGAYSVPGGMVYKFSNTGVLARDEAELPLLTEIRQYIEKIAGVQFNFCLVNYYATGDNTIGWHSDDEDDMIKGAVIASFTIGASRDFDFRLKSDRSVKHRVVLEDNMLCLMLHPTNEQWEHSLPKRSRIQTPRVNFTFRQFRPQQNRNKRRLQDANANDDERPSLF